MSNNGNRRWSQRKFNSEWAKRKSHGAQRRLAEHLRVSDTTAHRVVTGSYPPLKRYWWPIANFLG
ncbi:MAG: hypothetical protein ACPGVG_20615, partial [Mycobacterium sp.]